MANEEKITEYIDLASIEGQTKAMLDNLNRVYTQYKKVAKLRISLTVEGSLKNAASTIAAIDKAQKDLNETTKKLDKTLAANTRTTKQKTDADKDAVRTAKQLEAEAKRAEAARKREAKAADDAANDYLQLSRAADDAALKYKNYALQLGEGHPLTLQAMQDANRMTDTLKRLDGNVGNFRRNVGNYASAFNPLSHSVTQIARELPSLSNGINTFLSAIGNNIAGVQDAFRQTRAEVEALRAEGKKTESVFQRFLGTLVSAQVLLSIGVTLLTVYGGQFLKWVGSAVFGMKDLNQEIKKQNDTIKESIRLQLELNRLRRESFLTPGYENSRSSSAAIENLELELQGLKDLGANQDLILQKEKELAAARAAGALRATFDDLQTLSANLATLENDYAAATKALQLFNKENGPEGGNKDKREALESTASRLKFELDTRKEAAAALAAAQAAARSAELQQEKFNADELRKLTLETAKIRVAAVIDANEKVLSDERNTEQKRLQAIRNIAKARVEGINAELRATLSDPSTTNRGRIIAERQAAAEIALIRRDALVQIETLELEYIRRRTVATTEMLKSEATAFAEAQDRIAANEKSSFAMRLKAVQDAANARRMAIAASLSLELQDQTLIEEERLAIQRKYSKELLDLNTSFQQSTRDMLEKNAEATRKLFTVATTGREAEYAKALRNEIAILDEARRSGFMTESKYQALRAQTENKYRIASLQNQINAQFALVNHYKQGTEERAQAEIQLAELVQQLSDAVTNKQLENLDKVERGLQTLTEWYAKGSEVVGGFLNVSITNNKNAIADQQRAAEAAYQREIDLIRLSSASAEEKAYRTQVAEATLNAKRLSFEEQQRKQDQRKAEFDKANAIAQIVISTALAVVRTLATGNIPLAIAVGAIGAAQLAIAIATPIPRYAQGAGIDGRPKHSGGLFWGGDGGRHEVVQEPGKAPYVTGKKAALYDGAPGTIVHPSIDHFLNSMMYPAVPGQTHAIPSVGGDPAGVKELRKGFDKVANAVTSKQEVHFEWSNGELNKAIKKGNARTEYYKKLI